MPAARSPPVLSPDLTAAARIYVLDLISSVTLFFCAALLAGRVWRFPFDDEVSTLTYVERSHSIMELLSFADSGFHPPLLFLFLYPLHRMGLSEAGMRICSLGLTALSLLLFQLLALGLIAQRSSGHVRLSTRLIAVLLFGLSPLAIGQGDAIRWYPVFALLFALFITLYLAAGKEATRLASAVPLGLAASTNFVAVIVIAPFLLYRYLLERRFRPSFDVAYWLIFAFFAGLGLPKLLSIVKDQLAYVVSFEFGSGPLRVVATDILGFFGGDALGSVERGSSSRSR
jgi:4-amino-4-deoxy-L-arabinose transferase-like glycosyltransferase